MFNRPRILRKNKAIRDLVAETSLSSDDFLCPIFVTEGTNIKEEISSMPGYHRYSLDRLTEEIDEFLSLGLSRFLLFAKCSDDKKDNTGQESWNPEGLMQRSIRLLKSHYSNILVMSDVALDPYSIYGHDGIVEGEEILNDETVEALIKMSLSHAEAGVDWVAPSDMMDGRIGAIRDAFENASYHCGIMSYTAKYASAFYGPFRDALDSAPGFGDKKTYQMDFRNAREAMREASLDELEGADMLMVKPALAYLDIIKLLKEHSDLPISAYQVSGEYSMIKAAADRGWLDEEKIMVESLTAIKRAGASVIASYFAKDFMRLKQKLNG